MKTVGDVIEKLEATCNMINRLYNNDDPVFCDVRGIDRDDLLEILRDYCALLRNIPIKQ